MPRTIAAFLLLCFTAWAGPDGGVVGRTGSRDPFEPLVDLDTDDRVTTSTDPWLAGGWLDFQQPHVSLPREEVFPVKAAALAEAMLENTPFVALDAAQVQALLGKKTTVPRKRPYLVRAMALSTGSFNLSQWENGALMVISHAMGGAPQEAHRAPLVVFLATPPTQLSVGVTMTQ